MLQQADWDSIWLSDWGYYLDYSIGVGKKQNSSSEFRDTEAVETCMAHCQRCGGVLSAAHFARVVEWVAKRPKKAPREGMQDVYFIKNCLQVRSSDDSLN